MRWIGEKVKWDAVVADPLTRGFFYFANGMTYGSVTNAMSD